MKALFFLLSVLLCLSVHAQEFVCRVQLLTPTIQGVDRNIINQLQQDILQYMNNRKWSNDKFEVNERIKCSMTITITGLPSPDRFEGTMQVQVIRPVYNSSYETLLLNFQDRDFKINYVPFQALEYSENSYVNNLTSILNFYASVILGMDYDSFSKGSGIPFFQRAQNILNLAANAGEPGWKAFDNTRNRYWLVENLLNNSYGLIHDIYYRYHREGLDKMESDINSARGKILECVLDLQKLFVQNPNIYIVQVFIDSKSDELTRIFKKAQPNEKQQFIRVMEQVDPSNLNNYKSILNE